MTAATEVSVPARPAAVEAKKKAKKEPKPKKATTGPKKAKAARTYPSFHEMISDAIVTLKERTGSSQYAIAKFIEVKHKKLPSNFRKLLLVQLKKLVASGKLVKVKNSFKLALAKKPVDFKPKPKTTTKVKVAVSKPKAKVAATKAAAKPKTAAKSKPKTAAKSKPKTAAKPKAKAKPKATPAKSVKKPKSVRSAGAKKKAKK